jgi:hypothetical protein
MYYRLRVGQYPNLNIGSDIILDSSPKPGTVFADARKIAELLRSKYSKVTVFNLNKIEKGNGFLHFKSGYIIEIKVDDEVSWHRWWSQKKILREIAIADKKEIDNLNIDSRIEILSVNRKPINNGVSINHSI